MSADKQIPVVERISQLFQYLGIEQAHIAGEEGESLAAAYPALVASLTLLIPGPPDPQKVAFLGSQLLVFNAAEGENAARVRQVVENIPGARLETIQNYTIWSDVVAKHAGTIGPALQRFLAEATPPKLKAFVSPNGQNGSAAGITYHIQGSGPPLVLLPIGLEPSQWDPILPALSAHYSIITLGGAELGIIAFLEERSNTAGYLDMLHTSFEQAQLQPGERVLEVGCGPGTLARWLARRTQGQNPITALDINDFLLREADALARMEGLNGLIDFQKGNALALPYPDGSFDITFAVTMLEEGDADQMLAEMVRVTKAGGRVIVIVRAIDMPLYINLPLSAGLRAKAEDQRLWAPGMVELGCADASLYRRFNESGLVETIFGPQLVAFNSPNLLGWMQGAVHAILNAEEAQDWQTAFEQGTQEGTLFVSWPHHCAVGTKPAKARL